MPVNILHTLFKPRDSSCKSPQQSWLPNQQDDLSQLLADSQIFYLELPKSKRPRVKPPQNKALPLSSRRLLISVSSYQETHSRP